MQFTIIFDSPEGVDFSFGLVFIPCPVWVQGRDQVCTPNSNNPQYELGSVRQLLNTQGLQRDLDGHADQRVSIVTHSTGHGTATDLDRLVTDLADEGFTAVVHAMHSSE